jgi:lysophospholipase L1-like esterase
MKLVQTQERTAPLETQTPQPNQATPPKSIAPKPTRRIPFWASASVAINGLLLLSISLMYWQPELMGIRPSVPAIAETTEPIAEAETPAVENAREQLSYDEWLKVLAKEAKAAATNKPERLTVLLGDSLSLWFPPELLPANRNWLNQGISGENAPGLLKRLNLLDEVQPQTIFLMVGINDLIKGATDEQILGTYREIIKTLKEKHPKAEIVMQSVLPHGGDRLTVEDRVQVAKVSNERIHQFNQKLRTLSGENEVFFLNLEPLFTDGDGLLRADLSTDGLHLDEPGYLAWRSGLQVFEQLLLKQPEAKTAAKPTDAAPTAEIPAPDAEVKPAEAEAAPTADAEAKPTEAETKTE